MHVTSVIYLSAILMFVGVSSYDDIMLGELPKEITTQLKALRERLVVDLKQSCRRHQGVELGFLLYSRDNPDIPTILDENNIKTIDPTKKVVVLIHGWLSSSNSSGIVHLKDAYLKRYDCNVISIDWSQIADKLYSTAFCHVAKVSSYIAKFLCESNLPLDKIHMVGHSMGAQIAGVAGQYVNMKCKKQIGRITGLDPSGPLFQDLPHKRRLDKTDAQFVDVIHTDQINYGYSGNIGHVDFHPNCGQHQPGCPSISNIDNTTYVSDVLCNHRRSLEYMTESVMSNQFVAVSCAMCPRSCRPYLINEVYTPMGEDCQAVPRATKFYLTTKGSPPYAEGWALYDAKLP